MHGLTVLRQQQIKLLVQRHLIIGKTVVIFPIRFCCCILLRYAAEVISAPFVVVYFASVAEVICVPSVVVYTLLLLPKSSPFLLS